MQKHTNWTILNDENLEKLEQLVLKGNQLHDQAIFDFFARLGSMTARLIRETVDMGGQPYGKSIKVKDCP